MAQPYKYQTLSTTRCTRIIRLLPSRDKKAELKLELQEMQVDQPVAYRALSYTWGGQPSDQRVLCDGLSLMITANAHAALVRLRRSFQPCNVWVDAICIDQGSTHEKNVQVPMMTDIYSKASNVAVWLGDGTAETQEAFRFMHNVRRFGKAKARLLYSWDLGASIVKRESVQKSSAPFEPGVRQLSDDNPYWTRIWTVQEVALNPSCEVFCGASKPVSFQAFFDSLNFVDEYVGPETKAGSRGFDASYMMACEMHFTSHKKLHEKDLDTLFGALVEKRATNPRDLIYGLMAIYPQIFKDLPVDYNFDVRKVFTQATAAMIEKQDSVVPLLYYACKGPKSEDVPSWVPDWTTVTARVTQYPSDSVQNKYKRPIFRVSDDGFSLYLKGRTIDANLVHISSTLPQLPGSDADLPAFYEEMRTYISQWMPSKVYLMKRDAATVEALLKDMPKYPIPREVFNSGLYYETALNSLLWSGIDRDRHLIPWMKGETAGIHPPHLGSVEADMRKLAGCKLMVTGQGYVGRCQAAQAGDQLSYLTGCVEPFVMRPQGDGTFCLVSPVLLREVHTQRAPDLGDQELEEYCLV